MNFKKAITILSYMAGEFGSLDKLKACKLFYYIDKLHLIEYGRFVSNDIYFKLPYGPIPSQILDILNDKKNLFEDEKEYLNKYLVIGGDRNKTIKCKNKPDLNELSKSEIIIMNRVVKEYGRYTPGRLIDISHEEPAWKNADEHGKISLHDLIADLPDDRKNALLELFKEDSDTNKALSHLTA
jgi:uncharacterized phage-associated protein